MGIGMPLLGIHSDARSYAVGGLHMGNGTLHMHNTLEPHHDMDLHHSMDAQMPGSTQAHAHAPEQASLASLDILAAADVEGQQHVDDLDFDPAECFL